MDSFLRLWSRVRHDAWQRHASRLHAWLCCHIYSRRRMGRHGRRDHTASRGTEEVRRAALAAAGVLLIASASFCDWTTFGADPEDWFPPKPLCPRIFEELEPESRGKCALHGARTTLQRYNLR